MTRKRIYQQPRTQVVELRVTNQLLTGSVSTIATMDGTWTEEDLAREFGSDEFDFGSDEFNFE